MKGSILLSEEHGVNPSILVCPLCGADTGIALLGKQKGDKKAPKFMSDLKPCDKCKDMMKTHVVIVEAEQCDGGHRLLGGVWYLPLSVAEKMLAKEIVDRRAAFITTSTAEQLKLPRKGSNEDIN